MKRILFVLAVAAIVAVGCKKAPEPKKVSLKQSAEIPLVLASNLQAGGSRKGTVVPFIVSEDVKSDDGTVVIAKGSVGYGMVVWSRSEGTLSAMMNQPARLDVRLDYVTSKDGQKVELETEPGKGTDPYEFTRENTGKIDEVPGAEQAWANPDKQKLMTKLMQLIESSKQSDLANDPQTAQILDELSKDLNLSYSSLKVKEKERVSSLLGSIGNGEMSLDRLARAAVPEINALLELTKVTGFIGKQIGGSLKGRTIHAYVGTPVKAYARTEESFTIMPDEAK